MIKNGGLLAAAGPPVRGGERCTLPRRHQPRCAAPYAPERRPAPSDSLHLAPGDAPSTALADAPSKLNVHAALSTWNTSWRPALLGRGPQRTIKDHLPSCRPALPLLDPSRPCSALACDSAVPRGNQNEQFSDRPGRAATRCSACNRACADQT